MGVNSLPTKGRLPAERCMAMHNEEDSDGNKEKLLRGRLRELSVKSGLQGLHGNRRLALRRALRRGGIQIGRAHV